MIDNTDQLAAQFRELQKQVNQARIAFEHKDWPNAIRCWLEVKNCFPGQVEGYLGAAAALRSANRFEEAEGVLEDARLRFPEDARVMIDLGWNEHARQDWHSARERWQFAIDRFPERPEGWRGLELALRKLRMFKEAERTCLEASNRFPRNADFLADFAWISVEQQDFSTALNRWRNVIERSPQRVDGWIGSAVALRHLRRLEEAKALLGEALQQFPQHPPLYFELARLLQEFGKWTEAENQWAEARASFPDHAAAFAEGVRPLRRTGKFQEAEEVLLLGLRRFPNNPDIAMNFAAVAGERDNWGEALDRWTISAEKFPEIPRAHIGVAVALSRLGRWEEAEKMMESALERFPASEECLSEAARLAEGRSDWPLAIARWERVLERAPDSLFGRLGLGRVRFLAGTDGASRHPNPKPVEESDADRHSESGAQSNSTSDSPERFNPALERSEACKELMMRFESLGENCELGLVQRFFGAEPLGLLRWSSLSPDGLAYVFNQKFAGIGSPNQTSLILKEGQDEFYCKDSRFGLETHTFFRKGRVDEKALLRNQCRRMRFLAEKFVEDLELGEKIFVYKRANGKITDGEIRKIADTLCQYGRNHLLCVRLSDASHPHGSVENITHLVAVGYINRVVPTANAEYIAYDDWLELLRNAASAIRF